MRICEIAFENRPRERLAKEGVSALSNAELLAIILKVGSKGESVVDMSQRILSKFGIDKLPACSLKELQEVRGIGFAKACQIVALFELNRRCASKQKGKVMSSAKEVYEYCFPKMAHLDKEEFRVLHLDTRNRVIRDEVVSVGTLNSSLIHPREVFKNAIKESANAVIFVHNHPSGDVSPSKEDIEITERLFKVGELLDIKVLDHVIVGREGWYGFRG